uniref:Uncharacterized protein n=1 Tax=Rhizophora mucronata TaxID=61149 RepID=A0A2P2PU02_RHIMU
MSIENSIFCALLVYITARFLLGAILMVALSFGGLIVCLLLILVST